ncbi:uncharacterized protein EI90DRAFT_3057259 [Cantharellus anzutake]|uniref:uncharacterized protein n=1 Tax=Cantharellus anzutake TaxID=1750568 RepID=UPI001907FFEC|nr:uncharacterized protein EI90DRAFT_3057259 [Cantharellus anzutake]KAF8331766.1 hypothetical protein EI90DRAFT_3057259 [Cantharellus anzutake]
MATALVINLLLAPNVYSAPIPHPNVTYFVQNVSDGCNDLQNCRTMWGIVYSCLLAIFACVWTAAHPNVPGPNDSIWAFKSPTFKSRFAMVMGSLLSPEVILALAWRQFLLSWRISKKCKMVEGWTLTHSYFVVMDGFRVDPVLELPVDLNDLQKYPAIIEKTGNTRKAAITKKQILDRSKGDPFSKFIIVVQLLWFITQYVGRWASHLQRSQLETMTLAYAALCVFLYVLWWHKPVNIQFPIHVMEESPSVPPTSETNVDEPTPKTETDADPMSVQVSEPKDMEVMSMFIVTGMIFGGIHCLAWSFPFPTHTEMILWRVSAIYITVAPVFITLAGWLSDHVDDDLGMMIMVLLLLVYAVARVILLVLTLSSLRSPPPSLYQTPSWSSFLPHFG